MAPLPENIEDSLRTNPAISEVFGSWSELALPNCWIVAGVIDVFLMKPLDEYKFIKKLSNYKYLITIEEGFINKGGLDSLVSSILDRNKSNIRLKRMGFEDSYKFDIGGRDYLLGLNDLDEMHIIHNIKDYNNYKT